MNSNAEHELQETGDGVDLIDARPRLPAAPNSLWDDATKERDRIADVLDRTIRAQGLLVWVRKSKPGEYPLYVFIDNWRPMEPRAGLQVTERSSLKITLEVEPYREHPLIYSAELKRQKKNWKSSFWVLADTDLESMATYLVKGGRKPRFFKSRIPVVVMVLSAVIPPLPWLVMPRNRLVPGARRTWFTLPMVFGCVGLIGAGVSFVSDSRDLLGDLGGRPEELSAVTVFFLALMFLGMYLSFRRPRHFAVPTQSLRTPRHEFLVDSWHVSVPEAGREFEAFEKRLFTAISDLDPSIELNKEVHQQLSPRGFEERDRYVLTKGQANAHVHIYAFGRDAFVGWDGYLNFAKWDETVPVSTNVKNGVKVEYRSLKTDVHVPTEFDLIELNALTELVHRALVREVKAFLKEKEIEADLDFQIIRGDRDKALKAGSEKKKAGPGKSRKAYFARQD